MNKIATIPPRLAASSAVLLIAFGSPLARTQTPAEASLQSKKTCIELHEQAQLLRRAGKLLEARDALLLCSQESCPAAVQTDCLDWRDQVIKGLPSVVVKAKLGNNDDFAVRVSIDGKPVTSRLDGAPISLDPGPHSFLFERAPFEPIVQQVLLVEGEKNRVLSVTFDAPVQQPSLSPATRENGPAPADAYRPIPTLTYVLAGAALLGTGSFIGFGLWGKSQKRSLEASCQPVCTDAEVAPLRTKFIVADASLATAIVASALATYVYVSRPARPLPGPAQHPAMRTPPRLAVVAAPSPAGVLWGLRGEF